MLDSFLLDKCSRVFFEILVFDALITELSLLNQKLVSCSHNSYQVVHQDDTSHDDKYNKSTSMKSVLFIKISVLVISNQYIHHCPQRNVHGSIQLWGFLVKYEVEDD